MKNLLTRIAPAVVIAMVVAGCGGGDTAAETTAAAGSDTTAMVEETTAPTEAMTETTEAMTETTEAMTEGTGEMAFETISEGALTVCTDAPYPPFEMQNDDGSWTGFDMDLMSAIADNLGLSLEVTIQPFDGIWLAPAAGVCDLVASAMTITEERAAQALFSDPYFDADQSLLVREADASTYPDLESLAGKTIAVQTGTTGEIYAQDHTPDGATLKSFDEPAAMFLALQSGDVDAILQDLPVNAERAIQQPDDFELTATFPTGEQYGFATSPDRTSLMDAINDQLQALRDNGTYQDIYDSYFTG